MFLGKTLIALRASLHPGVQMGAGEFNAGGNPAMDWHPIQEGVEIFLVAHVTETGDKRQPDGPLGRNGLYLTTSKQLVNEMCCFLIAELLCLKAHKQSPILHKIWRPNDLNRPFLIY